MISVIAKKICKFLFLACFILSGHNLCAHPFLWQASGEYTFYLFGTIHVPDPRIATLPNEVADAVDDSTVFYGELNLAEENLLEIRHSMLIPGDKTLYDFLSFKTQDKVDRYLTSINPELNLDYFANQKIWVLAVTLTLLEQQLRYPRLYPNDVVLFKKAVTLGKKVGGLETIEEQTSVFDALSIAEQIQLLEDTVDYLDKQQDSFIGLSVQDYIDGDLDSLMKHLLSYMQGDELYEDLLFQLMDQRNIHMADRMMKLVSKNPEERFFFSVGVGHFWGDTSIIELLKEQGYTIELVESH